MNKRLISAILLMCFTFLGTATYAQNFASGTVLSTNSTIKYNDYLYAVQNGGKSSLRVASNYSVIDISTSLSTLISSSGGEMISVTSSKSQGLFSAGQVIGVCRNAITRCFAASNGNAILVLGSGKDKFEITESFTAISSILLSSLNGGGGGGTFTQLSGDVVSGSTGGATFIQTGAVTSGKILDGTIIAADLSTGVNTTLTQVTTNQTNVANLYSLSGVSFGATNLGTFTGTTISDATTYKGAAQQLETAVELKQDKVQFKQSGTNVSTSGAFTKYNFIGATVAANGGDATQADVTITSGATTNTLTATSSSIVSTVNGTAATLTPSSGTPTQMLGFDVSGNLVKAAASSGIQEYDAGNGCSVVASGTGVTFTRTTASVWTFVIPSGVKLLSHRIYSIAGENPGTNVTLTYNYTANTLTNQGFSTARPPSLTAWNMQTGVNTQAATGGSLAANFRPAINAVSGGNITILATLGSNAGTGETLITGNF